MKIKILDKTVTFDGTVLFMSIIIAATAVACLAFAGFVVYLIWRDWGWWFPGGILILIVLGVIIYPYVKKHNDGWEL